MSGSPPRLVHQQNSVQVKLHGLLVCFSHLRWNFVFQRPQHLLSRAAKNFTVLFYEEPLFVDNSRAKLDIKTSDEGVIVVTPILPKGLTSAECAFMQRSLVDMLLEKHAGRPRVAWYYTPMALQFTQHVKFDCVIYDCMDELSGFKGAPSNISELEKILMQKADIMFTGGQSLFQAKKDQHHNIHAYSSSIDRQHFARARDAVTIDPDDQRHIPRPRVGFFGVIDERTDLKLMEEVATLRPSVQFIILGPVVKIDEQSLPRLPNIHWLGQKDYRELPLYMAHWDIGFMPFAINEATQFISPTKTPEFLAAGLPVVSTPIVDVVRNWGKSGLVQIAETSVQMCNEIDRALVVDRSLWLKRVEQVLLPLSWDLTFASMLNHINTHLWTNKTGNVLASASHLSFTGEANV